MIGSASDRHPTLPAAAHAGRYTLVEPCCGSAALTLHLLGARKAIVPYQGSKWRYRGALAAKAAALGFNGPPSRVSLTDVGPWGIAMGVILRRDLRAKLLVELAGLAERDPREVYDGIQGAVVPVDSVRFAAEYLFLQRSAFYGKAVGTRCARWSSPGLNLTSAYGVPASATFGAIKPLMPALIRTLAGYDFLDVDVEARRGPAQVEAIDGPVLVYLDPPYAGTTGYPGGTLSRSDVHTLAHAWAATGASVIVSEQVALDIPGWSSEVLTAQNDRTGHAFGRNAEWITWS